MFLNNPSKNDCRTCFNCSSKLNPLTARTRDYKKRLKTLAELLEEITEIKIKDDKYPELPQCICVHCSRRLKSAHTFIQQAKGANDHYYSSLNEKLDCLQESQIDLEPCVEIKIEDYSQQAESNENLDSLQESQIGLDDCEEVKDENEKQEFDCLQEREISLETAPEINTKKDLENQKKFRLERESFAKEIEELMNEKNSESPTTIRTKNVTPSKSLESDSESLPSNDPNNCEETSPKIKQNDEIFPLNPNEEELLNDVAVPCNKCNKIFKNSKLLAVHQRISHIPEDKKCTCHLCGNKFTRYCNMYKHMRMFHGPETVTLLSKRPEEDYIYKCDLCPKKYSRKKSLVYHAKLKHSPNAATKEIQENKQIFKNKQEKTIDKGSLCPICGSSFTSKNQLTVHLRRHSGERPFKCDLCEKAFLLVTQLNSHKRLHTGEKPYKCQVCAKAFRVSDDLRQHMRTHTNVRPHKCSQCERSFKHPQDLKIHIRSHTGERPYVCAVCGDSFQRYNSLRTHRIRMGHVERNSLNEKC